MCTNVATFTNTLFRTIKNNISTRYANFRYVLINLNRSTVFSRVNNATTVKKKIRSSIIYTRVVVHAGGFRCVLVSCEDV